MYVITKSKIFTKIYFFYQINLSVNYIEYDTILLFSVIFRTQD